MNDKDFSQYKCYNNIEYSFSTNLFNGYQRNANECDKTRIHSLSIFAKVQMWLLWHKIKDKLKQSKHIWKIKG